MALAYFLAEVWHGASRRTWLLARIAAAIAIMGPALLWLLDRPLCAFVGVDSVNPNSAACPATIPTAVLTVRTLAMVVVVVVGLILLIRQFVGLESRRGLAGRPPLALVPAAGRDRRRRGGRPGRRVAPARTPRS